jgi:hypothetical protein
MPMSTSRAAFYAQQYFPVKYYKDLYEITLEEAKDTQEAREELLKLQIEADKTLQDLADTYRPPRGLTPSEKRQLTEAELLVAQENRNIEVADKNRRAFAANPAKAVLDQIENDIDRVDTATGSPPAAGSAEMQSLINAAAKSALSKVDNKAIQRQIFLDMTAAGRGPSLSVLQDATGETGLTINSVKKQAASPEDVKSRQAFKEGGGGKLSPAAEDAQLMIDAQKSAYMDGSLENLGHVASGLTKDQDDILRLYLQRLQDNESPGVVTPEEIKDEPRLAKGEAIWNEVAASGSGLKTSSKWFQLDYLQALQTRDQIVKKIEKDPFQGLSPQEWAAREAFDRGGYTAEEVHYLDALANNPKRAELVRPAYKRAREGLEPKTELEKVIAAAYEMDPDLSVDEIESYVDKVQRMQRKGGRIVARAEGGEQGKATRKAAREAARGIETDDLQAAQAYLVALKLPPNQVEPGIAAPPPAKRPELPADKANAAVDRAEAEAPPPPAPPAPTPEGGGAVSPPTPPTPEGEGEGDVPTDEDFEQEVARRVDPTDPRFSYQMTPSGDSYIVYKDGVQQSTPARKGTRAFSSITSVLGGGPALSQRPTGGTGTTGESQDSRTGTTGESQDSSTVSAVTSSVDQFLSRKPVQKIDLGVSDRPAIPLPEAAPAPAPAAAPAPAPAPAPAAAPPPVSEAQQLRSLIKSGAIPRGTPQYDATIQRLADLEG